MKQLSYKDFFATLAADKRLDILQYLHTNGAQNVSEISLGTGQEQSAVSHSLKKLLGCQCVHVEVRGKNRYYSLNSETIVPLLGLVDTHLKNYCHTSCQDCRDTA